MISLCSFIQAKTRRGQSASVHMQNRRTSSHWLRTNACVWMALARESKGAHVKAVGEPPVCDSPCSGWNSLEWQQYRSKYFFKEEFWSSNMHSTVYQISAYVGVVVWAPSDYFLSLLHFSARIPGQTVSFNQGEYKRFLMFSC